VIFFIICTIAALIKFEIYDLHHLFSKASGFAIGYIFPFFLCLWVVFFSTARPRVNYIISNDLTGIDPIAVGLPVLKSTNNFDLLDYSKTGTWASHNLE
jgi:hypothetical protein